VLLQGAWSTSVYAGGGWKTNYLIDQNTGKGAKSVTFRPDLPTSGMYSISAWHPDQSNNAVNVPTNVPMDIVSAEGTRTVLVNQQVNGCVRIRTTGTANYVVADAMKFTWVGAAGGY